MPSHFTPVFSHFLWLNADETTWSRMSTFRVMCSSGRRGRLRIWMLRIAAHIFCNWNNYHLHLKTFGMARWQFIITITILSSFFRFHSLSVRSNLPPSPNLNPHLFLLLAKYIFRLSGINYSLFDLSNWGCCNICGSSILRLLKFARQVSSIMYASALTHMGLHAEVSSSQLSITTCSIVFRRFQLWKFSLMSHLSRDE